jgi:hypothetical protein
MATTDFVTLGNRALSKAGHYDFITSLTDGTKASSLIKINYIPVLRAMLRAHPWNFATKRASLSPLSAQPTWSDGGEQFFQLPADCVRVLQMQYLDDPFKVEGGALYYYGTTANILYTSFVQDPNLFDDLFSEAYTTMLAATIAPGLTDSEGKVSELVSLYEKLNMPLARSINGQEMGVRTTQANSFINSRA